MGGLVVFHPSDFALSPFLAPNPKAAERVLEFFLTQIANDNTRAAYLNATKRFTRWCEANGIPELKDVRPFHIALFLKDLQGRLSVPTVKQQLAAIRMLFDWLVVGQVIESNPSHAVRGPKYSVTTGKTPILTVAEAETLLGSICADTPPTLVQLRDRAIIGTMIYTFARISAVLKMNVSDYFSQGMRGWVRLHEKGGKEHHVPCHRHLDRFLSEYLAAAPFAADRNGPMFRAP